MKRLLLFFPPMSSAGHWAGFSAGFLSIELPPGLLANPLSLVWDHLYLIQVKPITEHPPCPCVAIECPSLIPALSNYCFRSSLPVYLQGYPSYLGIYFVDLDFIVPMSAKFYLSSYKFGRVGMACGQHGGPLKSKSTKYIPRPDG